MNICIKYLFVNSIRTSLLVYKRHQFSALLIYNYKHYGKLARMFHRIILTKIRTSSKSNFSCNLNVNEQNTLFEFICIRFGT